MSMTVLINGIWVEALKEGEDLIESLSTRIVGRCPR